MNKLKIILPGGSGFLGRTLARWYSSRDAECVVLSRNPRALEFGRAVAWGGISLLSR